MMNKVLKKVVALTLALATVVTGVLATNVTEVKANTIPPTESWELGPGCESAAYYEDYPKDEIIDLGDVAKENENVIFRLYNKENGDHLYTQNPNDIWNLLFPQRKYKSYNWSYECAGWTSPIHSDIVLTRMYNPNSGEHFYTMNGAEVDMLVNAGWINDGIAFYSSTEEGSIPIYRVFNPNATSCSHHYTLDMNEVNHLVSLGWIYEGIGWYGKPNSIAKVNEINSQKDIDVYIYNTGINRYIDSIGRIDRINYESRFLSLYKGDVTVNTSTNSISYTRGHWDDLKNKVLICRRCYSIINIW